MALLISLSSNPDKRHHLSLMGHRIFIQQNTTPMLRAFVFWLPMVVIGMVNGVFRALVLMEFMPENVARQVSTFILIALLANYILQIFPRLHIHTMTEAFRAGFIWMILTLGFESLLGYFVSGLTWKQVFAEYDLSQGKLWTFVLVALIVIPMVIFQKQKPQHA